MEKKNIQFAFFGTGDFGAEVLNTLINNGYTPSVIITAPDRPVGRHQVLTPPPVKAFLERGTGNGEQGIILQPEKLDKAFSHQLSAISPDIFIVADYGKILPLNIINIPKHGTLNVHPSLLPKFRGASPIQSFILSDENIIPTQSRDAQNSNSDKIGKNFGTGVTIIQMDEEMDHGDIVISRQLSAVRQNLKYQELEKELAKLGGNLLVEILPKYLNGEIKPIPQNHSQATYTKKIKKEDGLIKFEDIENQGEKIYKKFLAYTPWPGIYFFKDNKRIIITDAELSTPPSGARFIIKKVKPEGKKEREF